MIMADTANCKQLTASEEQKDGDQTVNEKKLNVDIFVLYAESDDFTTREILDTLFHDKHISYRCLEKHGDPGNTIFDDFKNLLLECKKENVPFDKLPSQRIKCIAKNDAFLSEDNRLISLRNLIISDSDLQILESEEDFTRHQLAKAGIYFIGYNMVKCFSCGISVSYKGVETESDIWNMHATLSPNCEHLLEQKGSEFINAINSIQKRNMEPTIVTLFLLPLKGEQSVQWPGYVFLPGERYKLQPTEL
ncbi:unnamed protein product [Mytilus edulis]|uniref:Uncharacterized protein n=1 Tax=Mytilus edulis TaxID=6550 RepID=A0A8S3UPG6_MYTED|nr:unnamed protein product [Mytilus edulis]